MRILNLIVTCGISQFEPGKLEKLLGDDKVFFELIKDKNKRPYPGKEQVRQDAESYITTISSGLQSEWSMRHQSLGKENSMFGAEIATLTAMEDRIDKWISTQSPTGNQPNIRIRVVILSSITFDGLLAAWTLKQVLEENWRPGGITPEILFGEPVSQLDEASSNPDEVLVNLTKRVCEELKPSTETNKYQNILLVSGGYKFSLPCLTLISLFYGIEMYFLAERSKEAQSLHARQSSNKEDLINILNTFRKLGWNELAARYLSEILRHRQETLGNVYGEVVLGS